MLARRCSRNDGNSRKSGEIHQLIQWAVGFFTAPPHSVPSGGVTFYTRKKEKSCAWFLAANHENKEGNSINTFIIN